MGEKRGVVLGKNLKERVHIKGKGCSVLLQGNVAEHGCLVNTLPVYGIVQREGAEARGEGVQGHAYLRHKASFVRLRAEVVVLNSFSSGGGKRCCAPGLGTFFLRQLVHDLTFSVARLSANADAENLL